MADTEYTREHAANELFRIAMYGDRGNQALICERIAKVLDAALPSASLGEPNEHPAEEALRALACWLGVGGYNAPSVDAEAFKRKIMEAVDMLSEGVPDALRYRWLRVQGAAFAGDPKRHLEDGLVYRIDNLDEAIDREMRLASPASKGAGGGGERGEVELIVADKAEWQPIETAPKDGREVILREGGRVGAACWITWPDTYDSDGAPNADGGEGWTVAYDGDEWHAPDAWQPLPAAHGASEGECPHEIPYRYACDVCDRARLVPAGGPLGTSPDQQKGGA